MLALIASEMFAILLSSEIDLATGTMYVFSAGMCWVAASFGINYLVERKNLALFLINGGYHTLQFTFICLILGAWH